MEANPPWTLPSTLPAVPTYSARPAINDWVVGSVLIASMLHSAAFLGIVSWHELLITLFLFVTAPLSGLFIAKAHMHLSWDRDELPRPGPDQDWATFSDGDGENPMVACDDPPRRSE